MPVHDPKSLSAALRDLREEAASTAASYVEAALDAVASPSRPGLAGPAAAPDLTSAEIADLIDHTQLRPAATDDQIDQCCEEATQYAFTSVCVHPSFVPRVARHLDGSEVTPCTVVGFPHGANRTPTKAREAERAVADGARELDMVLALGAVTSGRYADAEADIRAVVTAARDAAESIDTDVPVKVILETALLSTPQVAVASVIARRAGADFVKTSTGFASGGARAEDVALMREVVGADRGVKASGGVGTVDDVRRMVAHGATRIGASGSGAIMEERRAAADAS